jgi:5-methylphenazine-1-carboxylate 1-monooxygenase
MVRALVVGAGIGGLTTALSLHAAGVDAHVIDSAAELRPLGVGINLLPHATRELGDLGLGPALEETAIPTAEIVHLDRFGNRIWGEPRGLACGYRWPQYSVHRGELQALLLAAVLERLGPSSVRTGAVFHSLEQDAHGVRATLVDRATGRTEQAHADVLVGADGLHSAVRAHLHPGEGAPLWNGVRMWRGTTETRPFLTGRSMITSGSNRTAKFVAYPISRRAERRGRALVNWVAEVRMGDGAAPAPDWNRRGRLDDVLPHFTGWRFDGIDVCELMASGSPVLEYPMVDRDPLPWWGRGRTTLLGDAAHPMYPVGSNGGSQAIIDARVLALELARADSPEDGLAAYERARRETVNAIVLANRSLPVDRVLHLVAERAPSGFRRIEDVLAHDELGELARAYRSTTGTDVESLNSRPALTP